MCDGYDTDKSDADQPDPLRLDIFLAEYVDGTMDPLVREVFEELMRRDPEVAERAICLQGVRSELCQLNCHCSAPEGFEARLRQQIAREMLQENIPETLADFTTHLRVIATLASVVVLLVVAGASYDWLNFTTDPSSSMAATSAPSRTALGSYPSEALTATAPSQPTDDAIFMRVGQMDAWLNNQASASFATRRSTPSVYRHPAHHPYTDSLESLIRSAYVSPLP